MTIQIYSNKYCKNSYYEKLINDFSFGKYLQQEKAKINNKKVINTLQK